MEKRAIALQVLITSVLALLVASMPVFDVGGRQFTNAISQYTHDPTRENEQRLREQQNRVRHETWVIREESFVLTLLFANACYSIRRRRTAAVFFLAFSTAMVVINGLPFSRSSQNGSVTFGPGIEMSFWTFRVLLLSVWCVAVVLAGVAFARHAFVKGPA